ncbi:MAG: HEPN domain-containing protein [Planktothrix sp.]|uniref:HEPN domain-containing protein n=2 Tax=Planktothrix sp. TaxID=3088171 RepID=UPI0038D3E9AF
MSPNTPQDWLNLARERAADADAIYKQRPDSIAVVYMAGYAIECSLKALLQKQGIPFPQSGREGHNLKGLWQSCRLSLSDLKDQKGCKTFFIENWNTDLRYEISLQVASGLKIEELLNGAKELAGWIQTQTKRSKPRREL